MHPGTVRVLGRAAPLYEAMGEAEQVITALEEDRDGGGNDGAS